MVKNSLLELYKKYNEISKILGETEIYNRLLKRYEFYKSENVSSMDKAYQDLAEIERIIYAQRGVFNNSEGYLPSGVYVPTLDWQAFYNHADELLYGETSPNLEFQNKRLYDAVLEALKKKFPNEKWTVGELPLFRWRILNPPLYEAWDYEIKEWEEDSNVHKEDGYYIEKYADEILCLYQEAVQPELEESTQGDIEGLKELCSRLQNERKVYVIDYNQLLDRECAGGYDLSVYDFLTLKENATTTHFNKPLSAQEQVINNAVVGELDKRCANNQYVSVMHAELDRCLADLVRLLNSTGIKPSSEPSGAQPNA